MTDFLFATGARPAGELAAALRAYLEPVVAEVEETSGPWGTLAVTRRPHAPSPLHHDPDGSSVVVGEPIVSLPGLPDVRLPDAGTRAALHGALISAPGGAWDRQLDGMWAALAVPAEGVPRVVTDRFGFIPVYEAELAAGGRIVGTHVDALARAAGLGDRWDPVSLLDLSMHLTCTFPFTPYRGVSQIAPGVERQVGTGVERVYWRPTEVNPFATLGEAGTALREAVVRDLRVAGAGVERAGILLSGGEDSRALLGAMPPVEVRAFTFAGAINREVRVARSAARAYGADFAFGRRDDAHYEAGMPTVAAMVGSMHLFMDVHGFGLHQRLGLDRLPVVIGGLSADSLLKAHYTAATPPPLPDAPAVRPELVAAVAERRAAFLDWLRGIRPETALEWSVLWPFSMRKHGANVHGNRRLFASHEAYHANGVLQVAAAVPVAWKRRRRLFVAAMRPLLRRSWYVPHARSRYPYFGAAPNLMLGALLRGGRGVRDLATGELFRRQGGWPRWDTVAGSDQTAAAWTAHPIAATPLRQVFEPATTPAQLAAAMAAVHPLRRMMTLQLALLTSREHAR